MEKEKISLSKFHHILSTMLADGILSQDNALTIYRHHLTTLHLDFFKNNSLPCATKMFKALCNTHDKHIAPNKQNEITELVDSFLLNNKNNTLPNKGKLYFWSDQHFYHSNIIKYSDRPFESVDQMNDAMISNYMKKVTPEDLVVFGGDISFAGVERTRNLVERLPGKKILVLGNHDFERKTMKLLDFHIFDYITMGFVFHPEVSGKARNIIVSHYPIGNQWLPDNTLNIHGHIHQYKADMKNINMSVEVVNYQPTDMTQIIEDTFKENYG